MLTRAADLPGSFDDLLTADAVDELISERGVRTPFVTQKLGEAPGPIVATSDYVSDLPDLIRPYLPQKFASLGADDHGFSDTRAAARACTRRRERKASVMYM